MGPKVFRGKPKKALPKPIKIVRPTFSAAELREIALERQEEVYTSDYTEYEMPTPEDEEDEDTIAQMGVVSTRSPFFPNEDFSETCIWYDKVLRKTSQLPDRLRNLFLLRQSDMDFVVSDTQMLELNTQLVRAVSGGEAFGFSRKKICR